MNEKFKHWWDRKLDIGGYPEKVEKSFPTALFDIVINVSDEFYPEIDLKHWMSARGERHWFPLSEQKFDMGLNCIYGAIVILRRAEEKGKRVYLHCHMGSNRSWTVACAYYFMRTGIHLDHPTRDNHVNKLVKNCWLGYLPPQPEMEAWLRTIDGELKTGMKAGILTLSKKNTLNNF